MIQIINKLFSSWNHNGIVYCSWKGNSHIDNAMRGLSDFDILIDKSSVNLGTELLKSAGFILCRPQNCETDPGTQDWIGIDENTGTMIHIHLHLYMIAGQSGVMEYILPWSGLAFSTRQLNQENGVFQMNPSLELILLYTRFGIEQSPKKLMKSKGGWVLKEKTKKEVLYLKERMIITLCQGMAKDLFPTCYDALMRIIEKSELNANDIKQLTNLMRDACSKWMRYGRLRTMFLKEKRKYTTIVRNKWLNGTLRGIYRKVPVSGNGLTVAFVGKDGTGRTMLAKDVLKWLNWKLDANYIYVGDYEIAPHSAMSESRSHEYQKRYNEINHLINKGIKLAAKGSVILFDRYPLEKGDEQINKYPKPDIVIYADDSIPYKEDLLRVKKSIWEHLNKPEYA